MLATVPSPLFAGVIVTLPNPMHEVSPHTPHALSVSVLHLVSSSESSDNSTRADLHFGGVQTAGVQQVFAPTPALQAVSSVLPVMVQVPAAMQVALSVLELSEHDPAVNANVPQVIASQVAFASSAGARAV